MIRPGDMAQTPHGTRLYRVLDVDTYPGRPERDTYPDRPGTLRAHLREIGAVGAPTITYPLELLRYAGRFG